MYTLVVVDMQPMFDAANRKRVREECLKAIQKAIEINAPIIFLEFNGYDCTHLELTKPCMGNHYVKTKYTDDGSPEVYETVLKYQLPRNFRVCGINTDCCVHATVSGMSARFPTSTIEVIAAACDSDWNHMAGINKISEIGGGVSVAY